MNNTRFIKRKAGVLKKPSQLFNWIFFYSTKKITVYTNIFL